MMRTWFAILLLLLLSFPVQEAQAQSDYATEDYTGMMNGWTLHYAYTNMQEIAYVGGLIYGLADGSLFSYDPQDEEVRCLNALNGLSGTGIGHIIADANQRLLVAYKDGTFDVIEADGSISTIIDLKQKQLSGVSKLANDMYFFNHDAYLACDFGVLVVNVRKKEIAEWYQPVVDGYPMLKQLQVVGDSLFAKSETELFGGKLTQNLVDFANWKRWPLTERNMAIPVHFSAYEEVAGCNYHAWGERGMIRDCGGVQTSIRPNGPAVNSPYRMTFSAERMVMVPGSRWTSESATAARVMILEDNEWQHIPYASLPTPENFSYVFDFTRAAIDPQDKEHFFVSSYGEGLYEFRGQEVVHLYNIYNSPLVSAAHPQTNYCRVDGVAFDAEGYLWMVNATNSRAVHVLSPDGQWAQISLRGQAIETPGDVLVDKQRPNYRWVVSCRQPAGIGLIDDGGTPMNTADDRVIFRREWVDNYGYYLSPSEIRSIAQDRNGAIWVGTNEGLFMISSATDFFSSNRCSRVLISRTDGSGLGDFMLGTEQINSIAVDGGNRLWIGTAVSGVYLMDVDLFDDNTKTVYHFTQKNSPIPSDNILCVAVDPLSDEVYIGTDMGLVSYRSDASEPEADFTSAYVFPNPVRPGYSGLLTIAGLMENSSVKITDAAGNVVYSGTAAGGTAVWDMRGYDGKRVTPGVYLVFCNSAAGYEPEGHKALKVLIM